ncbi:MAG TPA: DMT family transporter [Flavisolibacter sp.]|jgi:drug/metabolite transporter (DMT)-like permease
MTHGQAPNKKELLTGMGLAVLAALIWSGNYIVARGFHRDISPVSLAFFRWTTATVILFPFAYKSLRQQFPILLTSWKYLLIAALFGVSLFNTFIYVGGHTTSAMNLAIIGTTAAPVFVLFIAHLFTPEKATPFQIAGTLLCMAGILLLISKGDLTRLRQFRFQAGDLWVLVAALSFAIYTVMVRKKPKEIRPLSFLFATFFLGTLLLLPAFVIDSANGLTFRWTIPLVVVFLYLGIGASVISFFAWNTSIQKIGPSRTALFGNLIPVFSTIEAVIFLKEESNAIVIISLLIIFSGLFLANMGRLKRRKQ